MMRTDSANVSPADPSSYKSSSLEYATRSPDVGDASLWRMSSDDVVVATISFSEVTRFTVMFVTRILLR